VIQEGQEEDGLNFEDGTGLQTQSLQMMMMIIEPMRPTWARPVTKQVSL
jgi:hypothetical protein